MANRSDRTVQLSQLNRGGVKAEVQPNVTFAQTAADNGASAQSMFNLSETLQQVTTRLEDRLDLQAKIEGLEAGQIAGENGVPTRADDMTIRGRAFNQAAADSVGMQFDLKSREMLAQYEQEAGADPQKFKTLSDGYVQGAAAELEGFDRGMAQRFAGEYQLRAGNVLERVKAKQTAIIKDRQAEQSIRLQMALSDDIAEQSARLFDVPADQQQAVFTEMVGSAAKLVDIANQVGADGQPLYSASQRVTMEKRAEMAVAQQVGVAWLKKQPDIDAGILALTKGEASFSITGPDGKVQNINLREMVGASMYEELVPDISRKVLAERTLVEAAARTGQETSYSNFDLAIAKADNLQTLDLLLAQIDVGEEGVGGVVKANALRKSILTKQRTMQEDATSVVRGSSFASGDAVPNPQSDKDVKDFNGYFEKSVMPQLAALEPDVKNARIVNVIANARIIPKAVKGQIEMAGKSVDAGAVADAADLIDRLRGKNPNMLQDLPERTVARIELVRALKESGYNDLEAVERADKTLDPANEAVFRMRKEEIAAQKKDYRAEAMGIFQTNALVRALPGTQGIDTDFSGPTASQSVQLGVDYQRAYEAHYQLTGRDDLASKHAESVVRGQYGVTNVNNRKQVMKYAPENYYSISGASDDWMRKQVEREAKAAVKNQLMPPSFNLKEDVILVPDPYVTPRTAKDRQPAYKLMYISREDGTIRDLLGRGQFFQFAPQEELDGMVSRAREKAAAPLDRIPTGAGIR